MSSALRSRRASRRAWQTGFLVVFALTVAGCGQDLDTTYASTYGSSVNGIRVLTRTWDRAFDAGGAEYLGPRLEDSDLILHVARADELPGPGACGWLRSWLSGHHGREAVIVLRDGTITPWLLRNWARETRSAITGTGAHDAALQADADRLEARAVIEEQLETSASAGMACDLFTTDAVENPGRNPAQRLSGLVDGEAPQGLVLHRALVTARVRSTDDDDDMAHVVTLGAPGPDGDPLPTKADPDAGDDDSDDDALQPATVLARVDGRPLVVDWRIGNDGGHLLVVATAAPLLDAAQVDTHARAFLGALTRAIAAQRPTPGHATWVRRLEVPDGGDDGPPPPNILMKLLTTPPFCYVIWQFLLLGALWLGMRAYWLGRVSAPRDHRHERFSRHVAALAWHLRRGRTRDAAAAAIARHFARPAPPPAADDEAARASVAPFFPQPPPDRPSEPT